MPVEPEPEQDQDNALNFLGGNDDELWQLIISEVERLNKGYDKIEDRLRFLRRVFWSCFFVFIVLLVSAPLILDIIISDPSEYDIKRRAIITSALIMSLAFYGLLIFLFVSIREMRHSEELFQRKIHLLREAEAEYIGETAHSKISSVSRYYRHLRRSPIVDLIYRAEYMNKELSSSLIAVFPILRDLLRK